MAQKLEDRERRAGLARLQGWRETDGGGAITKTYTFADFPAAFAFMTRGALAAERMNHHPEWSNIYNRVEVKLTTHSASGVTNLDMCLAALMDQAAS